MVALSGTFSRLKEYKVLVIGDLMLDVYTLGNVKRISPEAPVTILHVESENSRPGGAANVAINIRALGGKVALMGRVGADFAGKRLQELLLSEDIDTKGVLSQGGLPTPVKNRLIASNQQLIRIDNEHITALSKDLEQRLTALLPLLLDDVQVLAISDYAKGFLSTSFLRSAIRQAREREICVVVDPKKRPYTEYREATIIKPNLSEAREAAGLEAGAPLSDIAETLLKQSAAEYLVVTRSGEGISIFSRDGIQKDFPVRVRQVKDVTGAGDTVLATLTCAIANGLHIDEAVQLANIAAGLSVEQLGCARITLSQLARRFLSLDTVNKVFDEEHLFALQEALKDRRYTVLGMYGRDGLSTEMFNSIQQLAKKDEDLIIYLADNKADPDFVKILASLKEVSFIIIKSDSLRSLTHHISPQEVYIVTNGNLKRLSETTALLA